MRFLPLFFDTSAGVVVLVGSGEPALAKLRLLRAAGAHVRWFSRDPDLPNLDAAWTGSARNQRRRSAQGRLERCGGGSVGGRRRSRHAALPSARAANASRSTSSIGRICRRFIFPAIVDRGEVVVAIGTGGSSPVLARRLRELIEALLPTRIGDLAELIGRHRSRFAAVPRALSPRRFWQNVVGGPIADAALAGRSAEAERQLVAAIDATRPSIVTARARPCSWSAPDPATRIF